MVKYDKLQNVWYYSPFLWKKYELKYEKCLISDITYIISKWIKYMYLSFVSRISFFMTLLLGIEGIEFYSFEIYIH
jgi:hypothetical protein